MTRPAASTPAPPPQDLAVRAAKGHDAQALHPRYPDVPLRRRPPDRPASRASTARWHGHTPPVRHPPVRHPRHGRRARHAIGTRQAVAGRQAHGTPATRQAHGTDSGTSPPTHHTGAHHLLPARLPACATAMTTGHTGGPRRTSESCRHQDVQRQPGRCHPLGQRDHPRSAPPPPSGRPPRQAQVPSTIRATPPGPRHATTGRQATGANLDGARDLANKRWTVAKRTAVFGSGAEVTLASRVFPPRRFLAERCRSGARWGLVMLSRLLAVAGQHRTERSRRPARSSDGASVASPQMNWH